MKGEGKEGLQCFKMYLGFVSVRCGKMTETKTAAFERRVITHNSEEQAGCHEAPDHTQEAPGLVSRWR